jgi:hypothetical protein
LDLLDSDYARRILDDAHRLLLPGGRLCLSSLTSGQARVGRGVARAWSALWLFAPRIVGGCRPIDITELLNPDQWSILENTIVESWGVPISGPGRDGVIAGSAREPHAAKTVHVQNEPHARRLQCFQRSWMCAISTVSCSCGTGRILHYVPALLGQT